jgi:hypothetical protein
MPVTSTNQVLIVEEDEASQTGGHYATESIAFDAAADTITTKDVTLPIPISFLSACLDPKGLNDGDEIGIDVSPETQVGALAEGVAAGAKTIPLPQSVMDLFENGTLWIGQHLTVGTDDCGVVKSVDQENNEVETTIGTTSAWSATDPVKVTTSMTPTILNSGWVEVKAGEGKVYDCGKDKIGGSYIPAGKKLRVRYRNNHASNGVRVVLLASYLY